MSNVTTVAGSFLKHTKHFIQWNFFINVQLFISHKSILNFNTSTFSQTVNATPNFPVPSLLKITSITDNSASMQWQDNSNNESLFEIFKMSV